MHVQLQMREWYQFELCFLGPSYNDFMNTVAYYLIYLGEGPFTKRSGIAVQWKQTTEH